MSVGRSDVAIPKTALTRRRNSHSSGKEVVLQELAPLRDTPSTKREELFRKKLELCSFIFDFEDASSDKRGKETKRSTLLELVDYVNAQSGQKIFTEALMPDIMSMVKANICRALPPNNEDFDPEEDEPILENSWPHLQVGFLTRCFPFCLSLSLSSFFRSIPPSFELPNINNLTSFILFIFCRWCTSFSCALSCRLK